MKQDEFFKIVGILLVSFFIIYIVVKMFKLQASVIEGLTNGSDDSVSSSSVITSGEAGTSASYAASIKAQTVKLQDELLISKYRKDYENVIINLDDYIGFLMIKQVLNMKITDNLQANMISINNINSLKTARDSLNTTMNFLDKQ
jgi:hypothetical protein